MIRAFKANPHLADSILSDHRETKDFKVRSGIEVFSMYLSQITSFKRTVEPKVSKDCKDLRVRKEFEDCKDISLVLKEYRDRPLWCKDCRDPRVQEEKRVHKDFVGNPV